MLVSTKDALPALEVHLTFVYPRCLPLARVVLIVMGTIIIEQITGAMLDHDLIEGTLWPNDR